MDLSDVAVVARDGSIDGAASWLSRCDTPVLTPRDSGRDVPLVRDNADADGRRVGDADSDPRDAADAPCATPLVPSTLTADALISVETVDSPSTVPVADAVPRSDGADTELRNVAAARVARCASIATERVATPSQLARVLHLPSRHCPYLMCSSRTQPNPKPTGADRGSPPPVSVSARRQQAGKYGTLP